MYEQLNIKQLKEERAASYRAIILEQIAIDGINKAIMRKFDFQESDEGQVYAGYMEHFNQ